MSRFIFLQYKLLSTVLFIYKIIVLTNITEKRFTPFPSKVLNLVFEFPVIFVCTSSEDLQSSFTQKASFKVYFGPNIHFQWKSTSKYSHSIESPYLQTFTDLEKKNITIATGTAWRKKGKGRKILKVHVSFGQIICKKIGHEYLKPGVHKSQDTSIPVFSQVKESLGKVLSFACWLIQKYWYMYIFYNFLNKMQVFR